MRWRVEGGGGDGGSGDGGSGGGEGDGVIGATHCFLVGTENPFMATYVETCASY